ncbi:phosphoadenosine phosphosulfate reductase family protein [Thermodesulfovibrio thiophilus]|uniref:phosphoadenosine phosphosulfate reductase domain-containing protein n=1 Tax=Thermodesulfovibrio thiophilus TaxID=340095 RepID=UPI0017978DFC|nr:phosphoadenosine phosphosulfate reductase family protein [Thermodesulfovibrio thiophilus]HHW21154.1 phosphoadenosine phosphosulfate reductase family protein [Thermodesulfovibrio thiophilus]
MYKIKWNIENNGVELKYSMQSGFKNNPRPVFYEELDNLGFNKYWNYPKSNNPLLWAIERKYFYYGFEVAEVRGGNIYDDPEIILTPEGRDLTLQPIDIDLVVERNKDALFVLENEALDFIEKIFKVYRPNIETLRNKNFNTQIKAQWNKIDFFVASFSGGKDSQVVLDLVSRVIPAEYYQVIYSDTDMELPSSIEIFEETKQLYQKKYPELKFHIGKNETSTEDYWKEFGPPSRFHRWCCSVIKTVPFNRLLQKLHKGKNNPRVLVFEGVRREESNKRSTYERIGKGVKHTLVTNVRPVLNWNITEIWLYLFLRKLPINQSYRNGLTRVGCSVCPFSSGWSENIIHKTYPEITNKYFSIIKEQTKKIGITNYDKKISYIKLGNWKKRAGGKGLTNETSRVDFIENKLDFLASLTEPKENLLEWLKVVGDIIFDKDKNIGEIKIKNEYYKFEINKENVKEIFRIKNIEQNPTLISKIKKVLYKTTYCIHCEACQVECPTGALTISPKVKVNTDLCTHCSNCLTFTDRGCLVAKSKHISEGVKNMNRKKTSGIDKYSSFGLREKWLRSFLENSNNWFEIDNQLGTKQIPAMINWLIDSELLKEKQRTALCKLFVDKKIELNIIWEIILTNLYYNSLIFNWVANNIQWGSKVDKKKLLALLKDSFPYLSEGTLNNPLSAFFNTIEQASAESLRNIATIEKDGNKRVLYKKGTNNINSVSILYSLYKYAEKTNRYSFTVSELYLENILGGPYKIFGISKSVLENKLRGLQENQNRLVDVAVVADLDTINLRKDVTPFEAIKLLIG